MLVESRLYSMMWHTRILLAEWNQKAVLGGGTWWEPGICGAHLMTLIWERRPSEATVLHSVSCPTSRFLVRFLPFVSIFGLSDRIFSQEPMTQIPSVVTLDGKQREDDDPNQVPSNEKKERRDRLQPECLHDRGRRRSLLSASLAQTTCCEGAPPGATSIGTCLRYRWSTVPWSGGDWEPLFLLGSAW